MKNKTSTNKKYEGNISHFCIFLVLILLYLYTYDHSFTVFLDNTKQVLNAKFHDHYVLNVIFWLIGFWGMVHLLNHSNNYVKTTSWILLIATSLIHYMYFKADHSQLDYSNAMHFQTILYQFFAIPLFDSLPYIGFNIVMILMAVFLRPLSVNLNIPLLCIMTLAIIGSFVISQGNSIQEIYSTPLIMIAKHLN